MGNDFSEIQQNIVEHAKNTTTLHKFKDFNNTTEDRISCLTYLIEKQTDYNNDICEDILHFVGYGCSLRKSFSEMYTTRYKLRNCNHQYNQHTESIVWREVFCRIMSIVENPMCIIEEYEKEIDIIKKTISELLPLQIAKEINEIMYDTYVIEQFKDSHSSIEKYYDIYDKTVYKQVKRDFRNTIGIKSMILVT